MDSSILKGSCSVVYFSDWKDDG